MTDRELLQQALNTLRHLCLHSRAVQGYDGEQVQAGIDALKARLAQPERAECDGGQCGIGGYCKQCPKPLVKLKEMLEVQGRDGTWNYDHYFHGMYNGMEVMLAVLEGREPVFREAPEKWLSKKEWQGLTDKEILADDVLRYHFALNGGAGPISKKGKAIIAAVNAKLKEKNGG